METPKERVICRDLGVMDYAGCWELQKQLFNDLLASKSGDGRKAEQYLLLCEHPPVYTLGKSGHEENMLVAEDFLKSKGASFYRIDRGGDITFHGPGQLVGYPILDLEREGIGLKEYIHSIEEAVIRTIADYGISGTRVAGAAGVWLTEGGPMRKIANRSTFVALRDDARFRAQREYGPALVRLHQPVRFLGQGGDLHTERDGNRNGPERCGRPVRGAPRKDYKY